MNWWIVLLIVPFLGLVYVTVKIGTVAFYRGREWYFRYSFDERENHGDGE